MYFITNRGGNLLQEFHKLNGSVFLLGVPVVGLEAGFIYAYRAGWPVSTAQIVQAAFLAVALILVGGILYHEAITPNKIIGVLICLVGLYFINK